MKKNLLFVFLFSVFTAFSQKPYVVLVSFDGFRHDYVELYQPPNFKKFIVAGSGADALVPSFPSKTFPNHYTIVTGLYPGNHGLVDNSFYDRDRETTYTMSERDKVGDAYYYGGVPLWRLVQQHGMKSASCFWVGSEIADEGLHPDYYYPYDGSFPFEARVDQVLEWLRLPEGKRPQFITLYFSSPDHEGHNYGPLSQQTREAVMRADTLLGRLMDGLEKIDLPVNVLLVSDHGMKEMEQTKETFIFLEEVIKPDGDIKVVSSGTQVHVYTSNKQQTDSVYALVNGKGKNFRVVKKPHYKASWHYQHDRTGDLMLLAEPGYYFRVGTPAGYDTSGDGKKFGVHGYDPDEVKDMHGIFYALGPNIRAGVKLSAFRNIHIYPLIAKILDIKPPPVDGKFEVLSPLYKE